MEEEKKEDKDKEEKKCKYFACFNKHGYCTHKANKDYRNRKSGDSLRKQKMFKRVMSLC